MAKNQQAQKTITETKDNLLDSIFDRMENSYHIPKAQITSVLRETAFKDEKVASDSEMISLLSVADKYKLDPFIREIYAFRNKKGVLTNIIGIDGWIKIMNNRLTFKGFKLEEAENFITVGKSKPCPEWMEIHIFDSDRDHPIIIREYLDECYNGGKFSSDPWDTHTKRFLRWKTLAQGVRVAYGVNEVIDKDEAERIDIGIVGEQGVDLETPDTAEQLPADTEAIPEAPQEQQEPPAPQPEPAKEETKPPDDQTDQLRKNAASTGAPAPRKKETVEQVEAEMSVQEEPPEDQPDTSPPQSPKQKKEIPDFF